MQEVLLDTNFIITCIKQKLDYFSKANAIIEDKIKWVVPNLVLDELKDISTRVGERTEDKEAAKIGLEMLKLIGPDVVALNGRDTDLAITQYVQDKDIIIATLDKELKKRTGKKILVIRDVKNLEVI